MTMAHYEQVWALWQATEGVGLSRADEPGAIQVYLERNPGLSFVALADGQVVGTVLGGHDGRRGFLHHLAVQVAYRRQGIAAALVNHCLEGLAQVGIQKSHLFIFHENESGKAFWRSQGWDLRQDIQIMSTSVGDNRQSERC